MMPEDVPTALYYDHRRRARWGRVENGWVSGGEIERGGERCGNGWGACGGRKNTPEMVPRVSWRAKRAVGAVKGAWCSIPILPTTTAAVPALGRVRVRAGRVRERAGRREPKFVTTFSDGIVIKSNF